MERKGAHLSGIPTPKKQPQNNPKTTPNKNSNKNVNKNLNNNDEFNEPVFESNAEKGLRIEEGVILNSGGIPNKFPLDEGGAVNLDVWRVYVVAFGKIKGIPLIESLRFVDYCFINSMQCGLFDKDPTTFYDKDGNPLKKWKGAFINFVKTPYDRKQWAVENGTDFYSPRYYKKKKNEEEKQLLLDWGKFLRNDRHTLSEQANKVINAILQDEENINT